MTDTRDLFANPEAGCCLGEGHDGCMNCPKEERALRAISEGRYRAMTQAEREYCAREISSVEGYHEEDAEGTDEEVARVTICAWRDYCRDKGML